MSCRTSWLDLDLAQHSEFSVFIGSSDKQLSLINQLQAEQVNVWSVTHKDHWRSATGPCARRRLSAPDRQLQSRARQHRLQVLRQRQFAQCRGSGTSESL